MSSPTSSTAGLSSSEPFSVRLAAFLVNFFLVDLVTLWNAVFNGQTSGQFVARAVLTSLGAYTGSGATSITVTATGALGAQDGVTIANGDVVFLPKGLVNIGTTTDAGFYSVANVAGTGTGPVLTRVPWWATGSVIPAGATVKISEGTKWGGTSWRSFAAKGSAVVDTNDPVLYFEQCVAQVTLSGGVGTLAGYPLRSATKSIALPTYVSGTPNIATLGYQQGVITPGEVGIGGSATQATVSIKSYSLPGTPTTGDASVLNVLLSNQ